MSKSEFCRLDEPDEGKYAKSLPPQLDLARLTSSVDGSVTVEPDSGVPDCQTCGVCCGHDQIVPVNFAESERLGAYLEITDDDEPDVVVDRVVERNFSRGRCAHLMGEVGGSLECVVYDRRPDVCRHFEAGSDRCHEFRRMYGLEPQLGGEEVARLALLLSERKLGVITNAVCRVNYVKVSVERVATEPGRFVAKKTVSAQIHAVVDGEMDNSIELHTYNPDREVWFQSEFVGMTVEEARELIASRNEQGVSN